MLALLLFALPSADVSGEMIPFHPVTITWTGPEVSEADERSPFTDYRLDVSFSHDQSGVVFEVPGFFAADGDAANTSADAGDRWRVRFTPPFAGAWRYEARLFRGADVAVQDGNAERYPLTDGEGEFTVGERAEPGQSLFTRGHLLRVPDSRYFLFSGDRTFWLKTGVDSPETLLGYHDIDGTFLDREEHPIPAPAAPIDLPSLDEGLHRFADHVRDWKEGDPTWKGGLGKGLIGGVNYLAEQGVNSCYFLTMNVNGDGRNVWPWTGPWAHDRFDVSKLAQWDVVFEHMQRRGIVLHVVLQETENDHLLDGGNVGPARRLYLREMVARFGHLPGVIWNLGEETTLLPDQIVEMADYLRELSPVKHPIVIHNDHWSPRNVADTFDPLLETDALDGAAIQDFHWADVHAHTLRYLDASSEGGKQWAVFADEMGGANFGLKTDAQDPGHFLPRSRGLWGNLMAGGAGVEWYFGWQNNSPDSDLSAETWRPREAMYRQSRIAREFFEKRLLFWAMDPADELTLDPADYVLAELGETYCLYRPAAVPTRLNLEEHVGPFTVQWFNPREGGEFQAGSKSHVWGPSWVDVGRPPSDEDKDWVCKVQAVEPVFSPRNDGAIVLEAEHFETQTLTKPRRWYVLQKSGQELELDGFGDPTKWVRSNLSAAKTASGHTFARILPDTRKTHGDKLIRGENFSPQPGKQAVLSWRVSFPQAGRYHVWARAFSTGSEDNGLHVGLNDDWPDHGQRIQWCQGKHRWTWSDAQRTEKVHCGVPGQIWLDVPEPGVHTVRVSMREDGFALDQLVLTTDEGFKPQGIERGERLATP